MFYSKFPQNENKYYILQINETKYEPKETHSRKNETIDNILMKKQSLEISIFGTMTRHLDVEFLNSPLTEYHGFDRLHQIWYATSKAASEICFKKRAISTA